MGTIPNRQATILANRRKKTVTKWYTKSKTSADISDAMTRIETTLRGIFREIIVLYGTPYKEYLSARHTKKYLYTLGIINDIVNHIQEYKANTEPSAFRYQRFVAKNNPARRHAVCLRKNRNIHRPFFHRRVPRYFGDPVEKLLPPHQREQ